MKHLKGEKRGGGVRIRWERRDESIWKT